MNRIDNTDVRYGRLVGLSVSPRDRRKWVFKCDCGAEVETLADNVRSGRTRSCGCLRKELVSAAKTTHGLSQKNGTERREIQAWASAKKRCYNANDKSYSRYGGRGISMCDAWKNDATAFLSDMGPCPEGKSLDRIDVNGNYDPGNCRWANSKTQNNNRRDNRIIDGKTIAQWSEETGIKYGTILSRLRYGWTQERLFSPPLHSGGGRSKSVL